MSVLWGIPQDGFDCMTVHLTHAAEGPLSVEIYIEGMFVSISQGLESSTDPLWSVKYIKCIVETMLESSNRGAELQGSALMGTQQCKTFSIVPHWHAW